MKKILRRILITILILLFVFIILPIIYWNIKMNNPHRANSEKTVWMTEATVSTELDVSKEPETEKRIGTPDPANEKSEEEPAALHEEYQGYLAPADDEYDYLYASDFEYYDLVKLIKARDTKAYGQVLGIEKKITVSETEMMRKTASIDSAACYLRQENRILLLEGEDFSRETDNYIIFTHELTHCARNASYETDDGYERIINYFVNYQLGTYAEEGIITNIAYELQGLGKRAVFYPYQSSCYRIIMDCTGYDAEDFMNHSVNYLMDMMDDYMGDEQYAYYIVPLIESISSKKYKSYQDVDFTEYQDLHDYMTRMYMKKYLSADMTEEEAEQVFREFCDNIMFYFDDMKRKYDIDEENFRPAFEQCKK